MKKQVGIFVFLVIVAIGLAGCGLPAFREIISRQQDIEENYKETKLVAFCELWNKILTRQWESTGLTVNCYPSQEEASIVIDITMEDMDITEYPHDELLLIFQYSELEEKLCELCISMLEFDEVKNVVLMLSDEMGELIYVIHNDDVMYRVGDESYDIKGSLITPSVEK